MKKFLFFVPFFLAMGFANLSMATSKIQMAILLDGSGSMQGLIDQTKFMLSRIINELKNASKDAQTPVLEIGLMEYGKENLSAAQNFMQILAGLMTDIDVVNEKLFQIVADGSEEYVGIAVKTAVNTFNWSQDPGDFRAIFVAGNETLKQWPQDNQVTVAEAIELAKSKSIVVNTIFAGSFDSSVMKEWSDAAELAGGAFAIIDSSMSIENTPTVLDSAILALNQELNKTYLPYGSFGREGLGRMIDLDNNMGNHLIDRSLTKATSYYDSSSWDLVDAYAKKIVVINGTFDTSQIPELSGMTIEEMIRFLENRLHDRQILQRSIQTMSMLRSEKLDYIMRGSSSPLNGVHDAIVKALRQQLSRAGFTL